MLATHRIWSLSHKKKPNHQFPGLTVPPAPHPCQGQQHCQHCCLNPQQSCRAGCASPHSPGCLPCTHIPQSPGHADPRSHCHSVGKQGGELSDKNIFFFFPWKMACYQNRNLPWEGSGRSNFCWGWTFQGKKAPPQPCLQLGDVLCVQGLVSSHEPDLGQKAVFSHLAKTLNKSFGLCFGHSNQLLADMFAYLFLCLEKEKKINKKASRKPHLARAQNGNKMFL